MKSLTILMKKNNNTVQNIKYKNFNQELKT